MKNNISTKIISLLFAIFLWFYIIQVQNPEIEKTIRDIPVQFTKSELENRGLTLTNDKEVQIDVKIKGQRKHLSTIKKEDVAAVVDVSKITSTGTHEVKINVILPYGGLELLEQNPQHVSVTVDEVVEVRKDVIVTIVGQPRMGYCVGDYKVTPERMKIKGPKSIVNTIEVLSAEIDVGGKNEDITVADAPISFVGTSGEIFNTPYVKLEQETASVHCTISKKKTVEIEADFADGLGYVLDETSVKTVEIAGASDVLEKIDKVKTSRISNGMISKNGEVKVYIELPEGVRCLDGEKVTLKVKKVQ